MISTIELLAGASLSQMLEGESKYTVPVGAGESVSITITTPTLQAEGLHLQTWGSSWLLACKLHTLDLPRAGSAPFPILELGAGTGLAGLAAAAVLRRPALLTDLPSIVPGLAANAALNADTVRAAAGALDWRDAAAGVAIDGAADVLLPLPHSKPSLVLATDTMYTDEHPALLSGAIAAWLARTHLARAVVVYPMRMAYLDAMREFWDRMDGLGLEPVVQGQETLEDDGRGWDDERLHEWCVWRWREDQCRVDGE